MWTKSFWTEALEQVVRTSAQAMLAVIVCNGLGVLDTGLGKAVWVGVMAAIVSLLTSVVVLPFSKRGSDPEATPSNATADRVDVN
ncbi:holin [Micromonospora sp. NPDC049102]|uniref:holin n=1 Tax=Micromonospora sp. NPDC049102 TaxID=3364265 RepID=UPI003723B03D